MFVFFKYKNFNHILFCPCSKVSYLSICFLLLHLPVICGDPLISVTSCCFWMLVIFLLSRVYFPFSIISRPGVYLVCVCSLIAPFALFGQFTVFSCMPFLFSSYYQIFLVPTLSLTLQANGSTLELCNQCQRNKITMSSETISILQNKNELYLFNSKNSLVLIFCFLNKCYSMGIKSYITTKSPVSPVNRLETDLIAKLLLLSFIPCQLPCGCQTL